jgi:hypothetical protein
VSWSDTSKSIVNLKQPVSTNGIMRNKAKAAIRRERLDLTVSEGKIFVSNSDLP